MNIPVGLIAIFIALSCFYYVTQKSRIRKEERRERMQEMRKELLNSLRRRVSNEQNAQ